MNITNTLRGAMRRIAGVSVAGSVPAGKAEGTRRTVALLLSSELSCRLITTTKV
jgi:hypothetical protein